jgi:hypothetical protein
MLAFVRETGRLTGRQAGLFKVACCRRVWHLLTEAQSRNAIEAAEAFADGELSTESFEAVSQDGRTAYYQLNASLKECGSSRRLQARLFAALAACCATCDSYSRHNLDAYFYAASTSGAVGDAIGHSTDHINKSSLKRAEEMKGHAAILRDIMGNPFRPPPTLSPSFRTPAVLSLAQAAYDHRLDPAHLAELADALEHAGCTDAGLLGHLRGEGHVRGCFAVDAILGKT